MQIVYTLDIAIRSTRSRLRSLAMDILPIQTKADYEAALREIEALMDAAPGSPDEDRLDVLATLVQAYEAEHYPIEGSN
jgi:antitoxin component HigA of HigAB toxin-antitoxin module